MVEVDRFPPVLSQFLESRQIAITLRKKMFLVRMKNPNSWIELFENVAWVYRTMPLRGRAMQSTNSQKPIFSDFSFDLSIDLNS